MLHLQAMLFCLECGSVMKGMDMRPGLSIAQDVGVFVSSSDDGSKAGATSHPLTHWWTMASSCTGTLAHHGPRTMPRIEITPLFRKREA